MKKKRRKWSLVLEGKAQIRVPEAEVMTKDLPVFYNPVMHLNRSIAVSLAKVLAKDWKVADILAGSGVRSIRFALELPKNACSSFLINDLNPLAVKNIKENLRANKLSKIFKVTQGEASSILLDSESFHYIDIDPFGSPNPFLDASIKRLRHKGILAVTATDTAALCGTAPGACKRKYWATPLRDEAMKEWGVRILARKVQLIGAQYEKSLIPICSHATQHYVRIYFQKRGRVNDVLKQHEMVGATGPLWTGQLWDKDLLSKMKSDDVKAQNLIDVLFEEAKIPVVGIYDLHAACKRLGCRVASTDEIMIAVKKKGHKIARSHLQPTAVRTTIPHKELDKILKKLA